ncbi:calmodulin-beta [Hydra vulgaris]|uniref:Calmodulin-beta n=1 Tax=Hydra vulgaris TaxID=6087 RepID=A0ABM4BU84_HYDVU
MNRFPADLSRDLKDAFEAFDKDGNGSVPVTGLREMLKTIGYNPTDVLLENTSILVDNGNGRIDFKEFIEIIDRLETEEKNEKEARDCFNAFDFMGEGFIASNDIKEALIFVMEKAPPGSINEILKYHRLERNRRVYFSEFKEMVRAFPPSKMNKNS